ncbi:TonB-dependent receptor [Paramagnetospirillum kuznetsovii]|uniref:TonB-dependent receptor n=1 Tax=Paramagnetospirillum kuznetsovii TaxID=2053833 RepID=UPI001374EDBC|nr:TonB-dependent receptor [Paramagnetospirillum kuznetsovii]
MLFAGEAAWAQAIPSPTSLGTVTVVGQPSSQSMVTAAPEALPASTTVIGAEEIKRRPLAHYVDIFRPVAGMIVSNFGQGGIGYGIGMRGFQTSQHGRDISYTVDGMPVNSVSNLHTPNYADLNFILPESIERVEVIRGPFSPEYGQANIAGAVNIVTKQSEAAPSVGVSGGSYGTARGLATFSQSGAIAGSGITPYLAAEAYHTDGYRSNSDWDRYNAMAKGTVATAGDGTLTAKLQAYGGEWHAPGYIRRDRIQSGQISATSSLNPTDGGKKDQQMVVLNWVTGQPDNDLTINAYVDHEEATRYSTSYTSGQQTAIHDRREVTGANGRKVWTGDVIGMQSQLMMGADLRADFVSSNKANTFSRRQGAVTINADFTQTDAAAYVQVQVKPLSWLKLTGGTRYDRYDIDLTNKLTPASSPVAGGEVFSPKIGATVTPIDALDLFVNYGEGFRTPNAVDELISNPFIGAQKIYSREAGMLLRLPASSTLRIAGWTTKQDSEIYQPPGGAFTNLGKSERKGVDFEGRTYVLKDADQSLALFASYSPVNAKLLNRPGYKDISNVPVYSITAGLEASQKVNDGDTLSGTLYWQYYGHQAIVDQNGWQTYAKSYPVIEAKVNYGFRGGLGLFAEAIAYPGDRYAEIATASSGVIATSPQAAFTGLVGVSYRFQ